MFAVEYIASSLLCADRLCPLRGCFGGGSGGVGASERACADIFQFCNKP